MSIITRTPLPRAARNVPARRNDVEIRLNRFDCRYRQLVRKFVAQHERLAELALSFPALLFLLAVRQQDGAFDAIVAGVLRGEKLAILARQAGLPLWLRKLPPEAFAGPIKALPDSDAFRRQVGNYIPRSPLRGAIWLRAVGDAYAVAHEPFALWIAQEIFRDAKRVKSGQLRLVGLWAWFSLKCPSAIAVAKAATWHNAMNFTRAAALAETWRRGLELHLCLGETPLPDMWLTPASIGGYDFVPLASAPDILAEAMAMRNCLRTYGIRVVRNGCRLWSVQKDGVRLATLEFGRRSPDPCPRILQLRLPCGHPAPPSMWWAAHAWVRSQDLTAIDTGLRRWWESPLYRNRWESLWRPYWLEKRRIPDWLPLSPSLLALDDV